MKRPLLILATLLAAAAPALAQQVAFTFDDLPEHSDLPPHVTRLQVVGGIAQTLKREHLPPVYGFVNAVALKDTPSEISALRAWRQAGQPLGNHTYSHPDLKALTVQQYEEDIAKNEPILKHLMPNEDWHWFRYPYLSEGETLEKRDAIRSWLAEHGYRIAQVSIDFGDYLWNDVYYRCSEKHDTKAIDSLRQSYLAAADQSITTYRQGSKMLYGRDISYVLLLHVGAFDAKMLPDLIALFRKRGFTFITLPDAMNDPAYREDPKVALPDGKTFLQQVALARDIKFPPINSPGKELDKMCR